MDPRIVLASSSPYRRELLQRLRLPFIVDAPAVDEAPLAAEAPGATALRLALTKARAVAARRPEALVIGGDQVAELDGRPLGKPGTHAAARAQLLSMSGREVRFHSGVALVDTSARYEAADTVVTVVKYRALSAKLIESYLLYDQPYDCAGSARIEALGISLVASVLSSDPSALIGLPLIRLVSLLAACGVMVPPCPR